MSSSNFDRDYYENGIETKKSLYENYRWMPERSFKEAHWFINFMGVKRDSNVVDYGCAKGFFVKAMRILGYECYGYDISEYAIENCEPEVKPFVNTKMNFACDFGFCKDVLEHCLPQEILGVLQHMRSSANQWLIVVPLGNGSTYNVSDYDLDVTHKLRYNINQWLNTVSQVFKVKEYKSRLYGLKDNWSHRLDGNLFIRCH